MIKLKNPWSPEDDDILKAAIEDGISVQRIAVRMKRTEIEIKDRARSLGLKVRHRGRPSDNGSTQDGGSGSNPETQKLTPRGS